jgi:ketosteroid isomerase-like protein
MPAPPITPELADRIRAALDSGDLTDAADLLDPDVRWGAPDDPTPSCQNRPDVIAWYQRARAAGVEVHVTEVTVHGAKLLVGVHVVTGPPTQPRGGPVERWQVLTVTDGRVVDIRGYDERGEAAARAAEPDEGTPA